MNQAGKRISTDLILRERLAIERRDLAIDRTLLPLYDLLYTLSSRNDG